jgi:glycosyltransferase involved in cell wall biosynthesis
MADIQAVILTRDEETHISRCIESIRGVCRRIVVVDCGSGDATVEISRKLGAEVVSNRWLNYATQFNHGLTALGQGTGWVLRIDADEYIPQASSSGIHAFLDGLDAAVDGVLVKRQIYFLGRRIRWGGIEPSWQLRLFRLGRGECEQRWMDEHILVKGLVVRSSITIIDHNLNSIDWWTSKHNKYASREVIDILTSRGALPIQQSTIHEGVSQQAAWKRFIKDRVYNRLPGAARSLAYFIYRYILRLGFLDGRAGYFFHVLQGLWYRTLVDAKIAEIEAHSADTGASIAEAVYFKTGIDPVTQTHSRSLDPARSEPSA